MMEDFNKMKEEIFEKEIKIFEEVNDKITTVLNDNPTVNDLVELYAYMTNQGYSFYSLQSIHTFIDEVEIE